MPKGVTLNQTSIAADSAASLPMNDLDDWHLYLDMDEASSSRPGTGYFMSSSSITPWDRPQVVPYNGQHQTDTHATTPDPATAALGVSISMVSSSSSSTSAYPNSPPGSSSSSSSLSDDRLSPYTPVESGEGGVSSSLSSFGVGDSMGFAHSSMTPVPSCGPSSESLVVTSHGVPPSLYDGTSFEDEYGTFGGRNGIDVCGPFSSCGRGGGCAPFSRGRVDGEKDGETGRGEPIMDSFDGFVMGMGTEVVQDVQRQTSLPPSAVTEENVNGVCLNDLVMSVDLRPASSWSTSSSVSGTSSSLCLSSSSSLPSSPLEPPAYPGNMPVPPGASFFQPCSPIWAHFPQPDIQVQVQQSFIDQDPYHSQPQYHHAYQHPYEGGAAFMNEFGDEVQKRAREERRGMWSGVDTAQLVYSTNAFPEPPPSMSLGLPAQMYSAAHPSNTPTSSMSSSPVATTFGQQYGDVHSMTNMNVPVSTGNTDFQQQQERSHFSYAPSPSSSTDMQHSYAGGREMRTAMEAATNDTQLQLFTKFRPPPIDTSIVPSDSHSGPSRPTTSSGLPVSTSPEVMPSPSTTARSPLEVLPMSGFSGHDTERQLHLNRGIPSVGGSGANTFVMNVPPSPYPSLPAGQEQPKVPVGLVRRARERKGSFRMFGRASSGDAAGSSTMVAGPAPPPPSSSQTEDSFMQQHSSSTESRGGVSKERMSESQSPEQARSPEAFNEASGSMTIGGRRMSLRKRKRGEGQESTEESERNEGGIGLRRVTSGTLVPSLEGSPVAGLTHSPEIDNLRVTDEQEDASSEFGRRQRRKRTHPTVSSEGFPENNATTGAGTSPLVASIPSRASADIQMQFVNVPEATPRPTPAAAMTGHGTPTILMKKRGKLPKDVTETLRSWLMAHKSHPYPSEEEKKMLCGKTQLNMSQVSNWMINARRRILVPPKKKTGIQQAVALKPRPVYSTARITPSASVPSTPVVNVHTLPQSFNPPPSAHPRVLAPNPSFSPTSRRTIVPMLRRAHALSRSASPGPKSPADSFAYPGPLTQYPGPVPHTTPRTIIPSDSRSTSPQTSTSYETAPVSVPGGNIQTYPQPVTVPMTAEQLAAYGYSPAQASYLASKTSSRPLTSSEDEDSPNATHLQ